MSKKPRKLSKFGRFYEALRVSSKFLRQSFSKKSEPITLLLVAKGQTEVKKIHLASRQLYFIKLGAAGLATFFFFSGLFFFEYLSSLPDRSLLQRENTALRTELNTIQYHLDTLQTTVDRVQRFNEKLRALTEVDKEFARQQGPLGQGGSDDSYETARVFDFGDFRVHEESIEMADVSELKLDRRQQFLIQRLFSQITRLYRDSELESQSVEELFEVLKGRRLQLAATPSILPVNGWVTSHFGYRIDPFTGGRGFHRGMDIAARTGTPIVAPAQGVVSFAGKFGSFGNTVKIFHGYGISTLYAHADDLLVRSGQRVNRGDVIATVGSTGRSTGPHLHYEVHVHGVRVDPRKYVLNKSL